MSLPFVWESDQAATTTPIVRRMTAAICVREYLFPQRYPAQHGRDAAAGAEDDMDGNRYVVAEGVVVHDIDAEEQDNG